MSTCQHYSVLVIAIAHRRSSGDLNSSQIQTKNRSVCENAVTGIWCSCKLLVSSWPFSRPSHMAQNQRCWDATCTVKVGLPKQSNSKQPGTCLCFGSPSVPLATQHVRYCTMWSERAKDLLIATSLKSPIVCPHSYMVMIQWILRIGNLWLGALAKIAEDSIYSFDRNSNGLTDVVSVVWWAKRIRNLWDTF